MRGSSIREYDVIVIGAGGVGSATLYHLAKQGKNVLGLEKYSIPHRMGSSHGNTRIIRKAYYEDPTYVPMVQRAYDLWHELQDQHGEQLLHTTGSIDAGPPKSDVFEGALQSCKEYSLDHEVLSGDEVNARFPGYKLPSGYKSVYQPEGGFLSPERCIVAHVKQAQSHGAEIHGHEQVLDWSPTASGVRIRTNKDRYKAKKLVITAGAWAYKFVDELEGIAVPQRISVGWFQPDNPGNFKPDTFPVFHIEGKDDRYYGIPIHTIPGFKIGNYPIKEIIDPDNVDRTPNRQDERILKRGAERYFSSIGATMNIDICIVTMTPDENFILDTHPEYPQVVVGAGFSGRGFKFASVLGEILTELAIDEEPSHDLGLFSINRFNDPD